MDRTNNRNGTFLLPVVTFTMLVSGVGTGGDYTPAYHALRQEKAIFSKPPRNQSRSNGFSIASDIDRIKSTLKLTTTELARSLGVSRQAPYNWIAGGAIKEDNLAKLYELRSAADILAAESLDVHPRLLHRKLPGGKTLLEEVASGGSGAAAAQALTKILKIESQQRAALEKVFAGRERLNNVGIDLPPLNDG